MFGEILFSQLAMEINQLPHIGDRTFTAVFKNYLAQRYLAACSTNAWTKHSNGYVQAMPAAGNANALYTSFLRGLSVSAAYQRYRMSNSTGYVGKLYFSLPNAMCDRQLLQMSQEKI